MKLPVENLILSIDKILSFPTFLFIPHLFTDKQTYKSGDSWRELMAKTTRTTLAVCNKRQNTILVNLPIKTDSVLLFKIERNVIFFNDKMAKNDVT